ncbi:hypothetical protein SSX86_030411 [Deinandra increscens subsp. villosa]|uniref:ATP-dependent DNA helicase n=1 Tax=Deinandra increscens subsp. villosa TaxID=3103831 RepID=A0AAP0CBM0_9ASTR
MRLSSSNLRGPALRRLQEFNKWLLDMSDGRLPAIALPDETEASWITIPADLLIPVSDHLVESILSSTFPDLESNISDHRYLQERCVLCPTNDEVDEVNLCVLEKLTGELHELLSADEICESTDNIEDMRAMYSIEFLNTLRFSVMSYNKISDLHPNVTDKWQINVMVSRIWKSFNHISGRLLSIDMILSDEHWAVVEKIDSVKSTNNEVRNIVILDEMGLDVSVSLWGNLARQISDDDIRNHGSPNIVIVLCSCRVRRFKGSLCLWTTASSQLYIDLPVSVLHIYKNIHVDHVVFNLANQTDVGMHITSMSHLLADLQEGVPKGTMYNIYVNVIGVDSINDWNYKLVLNVIESGVQASFVLFDDSAIPFVDFTVDELIEKSNLEGDDNPEWVVDFLKELLLARFDGECAIDEEKEFHSKIIEEEMELADEALLDPRTLSIRSNSSLTMVDVVSPVSVSVVNEVDTRDEDTSDVVVPDVESGGSVGRSRPRRKNVKTPIRYRT